LRRSPSIAAAHGRPRRAVLIDDEAFTDKRLVDTLPRLLQSHAGLDLVAADTWDAPFAAQCAKALIEGETAGLASTVIFFLDLVFPDGQFQGDKILRFIRETHRDTPVVVLTARERGGEDLLRNLVNLRATAYQPKSLLAKGKFAPAVQEIISRLAPHEPPFKLQLIVLVDGVVKEDSEKENPGRWPINQQSVRLTKRVVVRVMDKFGRHVLPEAGIPAIPEVSWVLLRCAESDDHGTEILPSELKLLVSRHESWDRDRLAREIYKFNELAQKAGLPFQLLQGRRALMNQSVPLPSKGSTYQQLNAKLKSVDVIDHRNLSGPPQCIRS